MRAQARKTVASMASTSKSLDGQFGQTLVLGHAVFVLAQQEIDLESALNALFALLDGGQWVSLAYRAEKDLEKGLGNYSRNWYLIFPPVL